MALIGLSPRGAWAGPKQRREHICDLQDYTRRLREEQDAEFQQSLEADRQREAAAAAEAERQAAAAQEAARAEAQARCEALHHPLGALPGGPVLWGPCSDPQGLRHGCRCQIFGAFCVHMWFPLHVVAA